MTKETFGHGKYYYFRDHNSAYGWGVRLTGSNEIIASVPDKTYAALIADLLNKYGHDYDFLNVLEEEFKKSASVNDRIL